MIKDCSPPFRRFWALATVLVSVVALAILPTPAYAAVTGRQPLAVVLCKFTDLPDEPHDVAFYQDMFSESGAGKRGLFDFWRDVSYGRLDLTGTVVKGWYTADQTGAEYNSLPRGSQIDVCATKAEPDIDFTKFAGVVIMTNFRNLQGPVFGFGAPTTIDGTIYPNLGEMTATADVNLSVIEHESGHSFGLPHSRKMFDNPMQSDYGDLYDVMSCSDCYDTLTYSPYQGFKGVGVPGGAGPGVNAIQATNAGWLPSDRALTVDNSTCRQQTVQMAALNHPEAAGSLEARIPAAVPITKTLNSTTADYYSVELRSRTGWDSGIPADTFLVHLRGQDGYSYWLDAEGALTAGSQFVDAPFATYVAVNSISPQSFTGQVTIGSCRLDATLAYAGATSGVYHDKVTAAADLTVGPGGAAVPAARVTLTVGTQSCRATTDAAGHVACSITLDQAAGTYPATVTYAGSQAYKPQTVQGSFTITKRPSALRYDGPGTVTNGSAATLTATLSEAGGVVLGDRPVTLSLGSGPSAQSCLGMTGTDGHVACVVARVLQPAGPTAVQVAFAGDASHLPTSTTATVQAVKGVTALRYDGPTTIANDFPATFRATLTQQVGGMAVDNRPVVFTVGSGASAQSCTGTTSAAGQATCTVPTVAQPGTATTVPVTAAFAGDALFLPAGASATAKVVFYSGRAFGASTKVAVLPTVVVSDTGEVSTAARSSTTRTAASLSTPLVTLSALTAGVTTGGGAASGQATAQDLTIGLLGLPVIRATAVSATSTSTCRVGDLTATTSGSATITSLTIGGVSQNTAAVAPNTVIRLGTATITLNEQLPVAGTSGGTLVNALHVSAPGIADVVVASARSGVSNCS